MKTTRTLFLLSAVLLMAATSMARTDIPLVKDFPNGSENDELAFYVEIDSILYKLSTEEKTAEYVRFNRFFYERRYNVPSTINYENETYSVTKIAANAFTNSPYFSVITIPERLRALEKMLLPTALI